MKKRKLKKEKSDKSESKNKVKIPVISQEDKKKNRIGWTILIIFGVLIVAVLLYIGIMKEESRFIDKGIVFEKTYEGKIAFYTGVVPVILSGGEIAYISRDFRNDPKEIGKISIYTLTGKIAFADNKTVYISTPNDLALCEGDTALALFENARFFSRIGLELKPAHNNKSYAKEKNVTYADCSTHKKNTVLLLKQEAKTEITQINENCYEIRFKDCEVLKAVERFNLGIMRQLVNPNVVIKE
jgi:hypothetical protein